MRKKKIYTEEEVQKRVQEELEKYFRERRAEEKEERIYNAFKELDERVRRLEGKKVGEA